jgi:HD-GYP domain-containing protein (c-di-GMP phosphodiesterase class II)
MILAFCGGAMSRLLIGLSAIALAELVRHRRALRVAERVAAAALEALLNAIDANDHETGAHVRRVANYALILARAAGVDERGRRSVERVALFHDIGKIHEALFDLVHDPDSLTAEERELIATHPRRGAEVLSPLLRFYPDLCAGVLAHHEWWDGNGYPEGRRGVEIPLPARIVAIADTFDVITHRRPYKAASSCDEAFRALAEGRGTQFDPELIDVALLPAVRKRLTRAERAARAAMLDAATSDSNQRHPRRQPRRAPDIKFRWRDETLGPHVPGRQTQAAR